MERLTCEGLFCDIEKCRETPCNCDVACTQRRVWERLKEYEDAEQDGRMVVMPCKVGDTIYITETRFYNYEEHKGVQKGVCKGYELDYRFGWVMKVALENGASHTLYLYKFSKFGKTAFLTREEAEAALKGGDG